MNPAVARRIEKSAFPTGRKRGRVSGPPEFNVDACWICGRPFKGDDCPHSYGDLRIAAEAWYAERLLS